MTRHTCRGWSAGERPFGPLRLAAETPAEAAADYAREVYRLHGVRVQRVEVDGRAYLVALAVEVKVRPMVGGTV